MTHLLFGLIASVLAAGSGSEPYPTTKLDWLVIELNSCCRSEMAGALGGPAVSFGARAPNTVVVFLKPRQGNVGNAMDDVKKSVKRQIDARVNERKWNWAEVDWVVQ